jgi:hypothetical protein
MERRRTLSAVQEAEVAAYVHIYTKAVANLLQIATSTSLPGTSGELRQARIRALFVLEARALQQVVTNILFWEFRLNLIFLQKTLFGELNCCSRLHRRRHMTCINY